MMRGLEDMGTGVGPANPPPVPDLGFGFTDHGNPGSQPPVY